MKINSIRFFDYRAFFNGINNQYLLELNGKNVLVYGENGSGKTSLFRGIKDFIAGADFVTHNQSPRLNEGFIEIQFEDGTVERLDETGVKPKHPYVINSSKLNSFISYKELLKTYLVDTDNINLFPLLVEGILSNHNLGTLGTLKSGWESQKLQDISKIPEEFADSVANGEITSEEADEQIEIAKESIVESFVKFTDELTFLLSEINNELGKFLNYFNQGLSVELILEPILASTRDTARITANVKCFGQASTGYLETLNEARLTALALSIYFSAIKLNPTQNILKVLFLDDVFIGLDMSNRMPLLEIVNNEFTDWQVFITTYDKHWFELAKPYLKGEWVKAEMYAAKQAGQSFETPLILRESEGYIEKAGKYYVTRDYPACLNYLRKELERLIKERLPEEYVRVYEGKFHTLSYYWERLTERYAALGHPIPNTVKDGIAISKLTLFNPLSHDNVSVPVYQYELEKAFKWVNDIAVLPIIKNIILMTKGMELKFCHPTQNYTFSFKLLSDWRIDVLDSLKTIIYPKCGIVNFQYNNQDYWNFRKGTVFSDAEVLKLLKRDDQLDEICENHLKISQLGITKDIFESNTSYNNLWTIKEIMQRSEGQIKTYWWTKLFRKLI